MFTYMGLCGRLYSRGDVPTTATIATKIYSATVLHGVWAGAGESVVLVDVRTTLKTKTQRDQARLGRSGDTNNIEKR